MPAVMPYKAAISDAKVGFLSQFKDLEEGMRIFSREAGFALLQVNKNKMLQSATAESLKAAIVSVALTGITLNPTLGLAYLVPIREGRDINAQLRISYKGMIEILISSGSVQSMSAAVIYEGDRYEYELGSEAYIKHWPVLNRGEDAKAIAAYATAHVVGREKPLIHIMDWDAIEKRKQVAKTHVVWEEWAEEMAIKTVIRAFYKYLPKTDRANEAMRVFDSIQNAGEKSLVQESDVPEDAAIEEVTKVYEGKLSPQEKLEKVQSLRKQHLKSGSEFRRLTAEMIESLREESEIQVDVQQD